MAYHVLIEVGLLKLGLPLPEREYLFARVVFADPRPRVLRAKHVRLWRFDFAWPARAPVSLAAH